VVADGRHTLPALGRVDIHQHGGNFEQGIGFAVETPCFDIYHDRQKTTEALRERRFLHDAKET